MEVNNGWSLYNDRFREDAHKLLYWGYKDAFSLIFCSQEETEITGLIVDKINSRLNSPDTPEEFERYTIKEDSPFSSEDRKGKKRRRIDIVIEENKCKPRRKYSFEAKRLNKKRHHISKYTGEDGLLRFIEGTYALEDPEAAMIGYVQDQDPKYWYLELQKQLEKQKDIFHLIETLTQDAAIFEHKGFTVHTRNNGKNIIMFHIFLDCTQK